jgi:hypothetical protein
MYDRDRQRRFGLLRESVALMLWTAAERLGSRQDALQDYEEVGIS